MNKVRIDTGRDSRLRGPRLLCRTSSAYDISK
jgi:hypothetical protein